MTRLAGTLLASGLLIFFMSLPLICRKIPMNPFFGVRIRAAFESRQRWYDINAYGGRQLARWSFVITACGLAGFLIPDELELVYSWLAIAVVFAALLIPLWKVARWSRIQGTDKGRTSV